MYVYHRQVLSVYFLLAGRCFVLSDIMKGKSMSLFNKNKVLPVPKGCEDFSIETDKSICTGEMTVGFRDPFSKKLLYAELARNEEDVNAYKKRYGYKDS